MDDKRFVQISRSPEVLQDEFAEYSREFEGRKWSQLYPPQLPPGSLSCKIADNVVTPAETPIPECQSCGACCVYFLLVGVGANDSVAPEDYTGVTIKAGQDEFVIDRFMRHDAETLYCVALEGKFGENVSCRVYEQRPMTCRAFEAGSDKCHALRRVYGIEPFLTLDEMNEANDKLDAQTGSSSDPSQTVLDIAISEEAKTKNFEIVAFLEDGSNTVLHTYNPREELWLESELFARNLEELKQNIASRFSTAKRNYLKT